VLENNNRTAKEFNTIAVSFWGENISIFLSRFAMARSRKLARLAAGTFDRRPQGRFFRKT
jgi:hypothetical protein